MRTTRLALSVLLAGSSWMSPALAADIAPATSPASQPVADGAMKVFITAVNGLVQVRDNDAQPWRKAEPRMQITEGAELRTGPRSSVTCVIPPDQTFTLDRLGTVRVAEAAKHGDKITTDLIMKYGRTHYEIEAAGLEHEASIVSPSSTLAVRGTVVSLFDQPPFKPEATSYTGRAIFHNGFVTVPVGTKNGSLARALAGGDGSAQTALSECVVDPRYAPSQTAADQALIATQVSRGAVLSYDPIANIPVVTGGRPNLDTELPGNLPGTFDIVLRWTGNADLNLEVGVAKGDPLTVISNGFNANEILYPGFGYQKSASGGKIPFDHRGGATGGQEIAYWTKTPPTGVYGIAALSMSGVTTSFTMDVYLNKVAIPMILFQDDGSLVYSTQFTRTISPGGNFAPIVIVPADPSITQAFASVDPLGDPNPGITPASFITAQPGHTALPAPAMVAKKPAPAIVKAAAPAAKPSVKGK